MTPMSSLIGLSRRAAGSSSQRSVREAPADGIGRLSDVGRAENPGASVGLLVSVLILATCILLSGCAALGYRLGSTLPTDIRTVYVPPFVNQTREPQLETETTQATIRELQKDGNLRVVTAEQADSILEVKLSGFDQQPLRYDKNSPKTTREFRMRITARMVFTQKSTSTILLDREVRGEATFEAVGELTTAKREALPRAAADLAHRIVETMVEYW